ncbi:MAG: hypothetical protein JWO74_3265, partial [Solirubrobacterales bacterium]|nr:hypothetical protein [Solirubrobacterales bacterium]
MSRALLLAELAAAGAAYGWAARRVPR